MGPGGDDGTHLSSVRARVHARIDSSTRLIDGARRRGRMLRTSAIAMRGRLDAARTLLGATGSSRGEVLQEVLDLTASTFPGCRAVSVTTVSSDDAVHGLRYATVAHTGGAAIADAAQYALDEGPCLEAVDMDEVMVFGADDLTDGPPVWPRFTAAARHLGIRSTISIGIPWTSYWTGAGDPDRPPVAAINVYASTPRDLLANELDALSLGMYVGARLTGADRTELDWST